MKHMENHLKDLEKKIDTADKLLYKKRSSEALEILLGVSEIANQAPPELRYRYLEVLGETYSENDMEAKAIECFEEALRIKNVEIDEPFLFYNLGFCYGQLGNDQRATDYLEKALPLEKERSLLIDILTCLSTRYKNINQYEKAISVNQRIIQEFYPPQTPIENERIQLAYSSLAICYTHLRNDEEAVKFLKKLMSYPNIDYGIAAGAFGGIGNTYFESQKFGKAIDSYKVAVECARKAKDQDLAKHWSKWLESAQFRKQK